MRGRLPYTAALGDTIRDALALDGIGRLIDVGCGPGTIALRLAHLFDEVVVTSRKQRMDAHRFYERLGFDATSEGFRYTLIAD